MLINFKRAVEYRDDIVAYLPLTLSSGDIKELEQIILRLGYSHIINIGQDYEKSFVFIYFSDVPDSDYANSYLNDLIYHLPTKFNVGDPVLLERHIYKSLSQYIIESLEEETNNEFEIIASLECTFEDNRESSVVSTETITCIEHAINQTEYPHIYNYDVKQVGINWKVNIWLLKYDIDETGITTEFAFNDLIKSLPTNWKIN